MLANVNDSWLTQMTDWDVIVRSSLRRRCAAVSFHSIFLYLQAGLMIEQKKTPKNNKKKAQRKGKKIK